MANPTVLRDLLRDKHWQTYATFCREYDKAAAKIDRSYVGRAPSRAQLHRWTSGDLAGVPHPQHCEVLEEMFPGYSAAELFMPSQRGSSAVPAKPDLDLSGATPGADGRRSEDPASRATAADPMEAALRALGERMGLSDEEVAGLGRLTGQLVDLDLECSIEIDSDGWAAVTYRFVLLNLTDEPVKRLLRDQWFENTEGVRFEAHPSDDRRLSVQRLHDIGNLVKFACVVSPSIGPGEVGTISYTAHGGRFLHDHFWQQTTWRPVRHFTLSVRHRGIDILTSCSAVADRPDGSQVSMAGDIFSSEDDDGALITITRDHLRPGDSITLRWEASRAAS